MIRTSRPGRAYKRWLLLIALGLFSPAFAVDLAIVGGRIIDVDSGVSDAPMTVLIEGERIAAVGPEDEIEVPDGLERVSAHDRYLLPGLIDMHVHAAVPTCARTASGVRFAGFDETLSEQLLETLPRFGITAARSPSTPPALGVDLRQRIRRGELDGPDLIVAGEFINDRGLTETALRSVIGEHAKAGVDAIKLYARLTPDQIRIGIDQAHQSGLPVIGHLHATTWREALELGIDFLTHVSPWTADLLPESARAEYRAVVRANGSMRARIDWMEQVDPEGPEIQALIGELVARKVPVDPTLVAFDTKFSRDVERDRPVAVRYRDHPRRAVVPGLVEVWDTCGTPTDGWSADEFKRAEAAWPRLLWLVRAYHKGGVRLLAGSDTPNAWVIPGVSLHQELALLQDAGIPALEILRIAVRNGAEALGRWDQIGSIAPGKRADLVVLKRDPTVDIRNTRTIERVVMRGRLIEP